MVDKWQDEALKLYKEGKKITDISSLIGKSRKTVSSYINSLDCTPLLKEERKEISKVRRTEQKKQYRDKTTEAQKAMLKRQHDIDVIVLSREKYY